MLRIHGSIETAVQYIKLFKMTFDKNMITVQLCEKAGTIANIITHLKKDEYFSISSIEKICRVMNYGVDAILGFLDKMH